MAEGAVRALSFHAEYRCRHSGACCTSNWPIPVEADRAERIRGALATGTLRMAAASTGLDAHGEAGAFLPIVNDHCAFFDATGGHLCHIHRTLGHDALPLACRQFPRVVVRDPRGVSVTLSHFCPTAAAMLNTDGPVTITEAPAGFPRDAEYEGLDARESLPPLLRPGMLMDWESWSEFERLAVELLGDPTVAPEAALDHLNCIVEGTRNWSPGGVQLLDHVRRAFTPPPGTRRDGPSLRMTPEKIDTRRLEVIRSIPAGAPAPPTPHAGARDRVESDRVTRRFLAAHAFANWTIHLGQGLRTWRRSIDAAYALIASGSDVREADLLLRHLCEPVALARAWSDAEGEGR